jgi:hypothetical protein
MKFISGMVLGIVLSAGVLTLSAQNERAMHPRLVAAINALGSVKK